jgi:antitoxin component HigA of HigAB toxin-antitoxin module
MVTRELINSPVRQGTTEKRAYLVRTLVGMTPTGVTIAVWDETANADATVASTEGSVTVASNVITTKLIKALTAGHVYRVNVEWTSGSEIVNRYFRVEAET